MSSNRPSREAGAEPDNVLSILRQLDAQLQRRREDEARLAEVPPEGEATGPEAAAAPDEGTSPALLDDIMKRLDYLDAQLRQMQERVQIDQVEAQLLQLQQLIATSPPAGAPAEGTTGEAERPPLAPASPWPLPAAAGGPSAAGLVRQDAPASAATTAAPTLSAAPLTVPGSTGEATASAGIVIGAPPEIATSAPAEAENDRWTFVRSEPEAWAAEEEDGSRWSRRLLWLILAVAALLLILAAVILVPRLMRGPGPAPTAVSKSAAASGRIVFQSDRDTPNQPQLYVVSADGTNPSRLPISVPYAWNPRFSPDGQRIAFAGTVGGMDDIYIVGADGSNLQRLTSKKGNNRHPAWSPDGQWLAFGSDRDGNWDIFIMRADGNEARNLTKMASDDNLPAWSPDGQRIAFQSDRTGRMQIFVVNATGDGAATNLSNSQSFDSYPQWAPTGDLLSFYSVRDGNSEIYIINADGRNPRNVTNHPAKDELAVWSPDGRWLVFASDRNGNMDLFALRLETGEVSPLIESAGHDWAPSWGR